MELSFQNFVDIFQIVAGLGTTGAFIYAGLTFRRLDTQSKSQLHMKYKMIYRK
jgi:hypothetical protein